MMNRQIRLGSMMILALAVLIMPVAAIAQTPADVTAVEIAIKAEMARPGSAILPSEFSVTNIRFEGALAAADVAGSGFNSPIVFLKKTGSEWQVAFIGSATTPADCSHLGFAPSSQICSN